jgi:hypothetical protein
MLPRASARQASKYVAKRVKAAAPEPKGEGGQRLRELRLGEPIRPLPLRWLGDSPFKRKEPDRRRQGAPILGRCVSGPNDGPLKPRSGFSSAQVRILLSLQLGHQCAAISHKDCPRGRHAHELPAYARAASEALPRRSPKGEGGPRLRELRLGEPSYFMPTRPIW